MVVRNVLVLGGYGLIGRAVVRRLLDDGHAVTCMGRNAEFGRRLEPDCHWIGCDIARLTSPADWEPHLSGIDVVVNASGALQSGWTDRLADLQDRAIRALTDGAAARDIRLIVQISAPGASPDATTEFLQTKGVADAYLRKGRTPWVIFKPSLVLSPVAYGGTALLRALASMPGIVPLVHGSAPVATVSVDEVAHAVSLAVAGRIAAGSDLEITGAQPLPLREVVLGFRRWIGLPDPLRVVELPQWMGAAVARLADAAGYLGWRSPLRTSAMVYMSGGVKADGTAYRAATGRVPADLHATLRQMPATVQEKWFGRLYLLMPLLVVTLSLFWLASGLIGMVQLPDAARHLMNAGFSAGLSDGVVIAGAIIDIALGLAILFKPWSRHACYGMIAVTAGYLLAGTALLPALWGDPLGPYVKTIPAAMLALVTSLLVDTRG